MTADPDPGPGDDGFAAAEVVVDETFRLPAVQHVAMEPHACVARWSDGRLEVTTGTQTPFNMRQDLARLFGLPETDVRVVCPAMGGSFGAKTFVRRDTRICASGYQGSSDPSRRRKRPVCSIVRVYSTTLPHLSATVRLVVLWPGLPSATAAVVSLPLEPS